MIKGMEILEKTSITEFVTPSWFKFMVALLLIFGTVIGVAIAINEEDFFWFTVSFLIAIAFCLVIYIVVRLNTPETPTGRYRYEVTFDESVKMTEVSKHYKIIDNRGAIYILEDLEPVEDKCNCHGSHICKKAKKEDDYNTETSTPNTEEVDDNQVPNYCHNCGEAFNDADKFCSKCGTKR